MAVQISGNDITVPRDTTVTRNLTVGGVLTYEDVTNVDSVGLITARNGIEVGASPGVAASISVDGNMIISGISTFGGDVQVPDKIIHSGDTNTAIRFPSNDTFTVETAGSESFRVDSSQRLLSGTLDIGYVSFADNLTLADSANCGITIRSGTSNQGNIYFSDGTGTSADTYRGMITYAHADDALIFGTGSSGRLRIDSSGRLLLGLDSGRSVGDVTAQSQIEGTNYSASSLSIMANAGASAGNQAHLTLGKSRGTADGESTVVASGDGLGLIQWAGADGTDCNTVAAKIHAFVDGTPGSNDMPGRIGFYTTPDGSASPTERLRIASGGDVTVSTGNLIMGANGAGISFAATADSSGTMQNELFDDYEEGTFTPTITSGGTSITYVLQRGSYVKFGKLVEFQLDMYMTAGTADGNNLRIGGLPFTSANQGTYAFGGAFLNYNNAAFGDLGDRVLFHIVTTNTYMQLYNSITGNVIAGTSTGVNIFGSKEFTLTGIYQAS